MSEKSVMITGAGKGIGRATALHLARLGFHVFAGVRSAADGEALQNEAPGRLTPLIVDVTNAGQIAEAARVVGEQVGTAGLSGLVNNAGMAAAAPLECIPMGDFRYQIEVNLTGQLAVTQAMLPLIRAAKGRIVNVTSVGGRIVGPMLGPYHASKFALEAITDCLRLELKPWGIEVIAIEPGAIATPIWDTSVVTADRLVTPESTRLYGAKLDQARAFALRANERGLPPERVAEAIAAALTSPKPRTRYIVGTDAKIAIRVISRLPDRVKDRLMADR